MFKLRASASGKLATDPTGKSNLEKFNDSKEHLSKLQIKYSEFKNKDCKSAKEIYEFKIPETKKLIDELDLIKDKKELSQTTKTYIEEWLKESIYGVKKEIKSKYLNKGLKLEDEAIDKAIEWLDLPFVLKNEKTFEDEFFCGTPDLLTEDEVLDIKCSWDCFTFPLFDKEIPTKDYFYQLQVYMHLTGKKKARLVYVLLNTPKELTWEEQHDYSSVDKSKKIKTFSLDYQPEVIEKLKSRVTEARSFIKSITNE